eukprot:631344-Pelagomonas_calceolata.AAC.2
MHTSHAHRPPLPALADANRPPLPAFADFLAHAHRQCTQASLAHTCWYAQAALAHTSSQKQTGLAF